MSVMILTNAADTYQEEGAETWVEVSLTRAAALTRALAQSSLADVLLPSSSAKASRPGSRKTDLGSRVSVNQRLDMQSLHELSPECLNLLSSDAY
jgi:hypothetical protein